MEKIDFLENKYAKWYNSIIDNAQKRILTGYIEKHHIIPSSLGGNNNKTNLVNLTYKEHFICHRLLIKITTGNARIKMLHALGKFIQSSPLQQRNLTSRQYEIARKAIIEARTGTKRPGIGGVKKGNVPWNKGIKQGPHCIESNKARSITLTGRIRSAEFCQKVSDGKKGHRSGMTGKNHSEQTKLLMRKPRGIQGPQKRHTMCPHCDLLHVTTRHIKFCEIKKN